RAAGLGHGDTDAADEEDPGDDRDRQKPAPAGGGTALLHASIVGTEAGKPRRILRKSLSLTPAEGCRRPLAPAAALLEGDGHGILHPRRGVARRARLAQRVPCRVEELV